MQGVGESKKKAGHPTILSESEEQHIAQCLVYLANNGHPQSRSVLQDMVKSFLDEIGRKNPFLDNKPGYDWVRGFEDSFLFFRIKFTGEKMFTET